MPKERSLPEEWIAGTLHTLNLAEHLGIRRNGVPSDLRIKRSPKSPNLIAQYLPAQALPEAAQASESSTKHL